MNTNPATHCPRCQGSGRLAQFKHVANGDCFACNGTGVDRRNREAFEAAELAASPAGKAAALEAEMQQAAEANAALAASLGKTVDELSPLDILMAATS